MKKIEKIILATDFSEASKEATEYASQLAKQLGANLEVVHVFDERVINIPAAYCFMPGAADWMDEYIEKNKQRGRETLDKLCQEIGGCTPHFIEGTPGKSIVKYVKEHPADLLVMGTHGYNAVMKVVMGSVAEYVLHHCTTCPVLTVRHKSSSKQSS